VRVARFARNFQAWIEWASTDGPGMCPVFGQCLETPAPNVDIAGIQRTTFDWEQCPFDA
jgi:hypothetical protein